jgi:hypothetical protein
VTAEAGGGDLARDCTVHRQRARHWWRASRRLAGRCGQRGRGCEPARFGFGAFGRGEDRSEDRDADVPGGVVHHPHGPPYSRIADALLDYQYWSPNDPQKNPYDDTGWTFPEGFNVQDRARDGVQGARRARWSA